MDGTKGSLGAILSWLIQPIWLAILFVLVVSSLSLGFRVGRGPAESEKSDAPAVEESDQEYTCSMHPAVRTKDPTAKCPLCFMDLIPVPDGDSSPGSERRIQLSESAVKNSKVETTLVAKFFPQATVRLYGRVTYDETLVTRLTSYFPGRLERLFVNYIGVPVKKGDHLAELFSPELIASFEELQQSLAAVEKTKKSGSKLVQLTAVQTLAAARDRLRLFGLTQEQIQAVESGELEQERLTIYSPMNGVVTHLAAREGDYLKTGEPIATVADLTRLWVDLEAYESQLSLLRWGQEVEFTVEAHASEVFHGRISFIEPLVDDRTRTAAVRVAVDNSDQRLKPGMFASAVVRPKVNAMGTVVSDELAGRWVSPMHPTVVKDGPGQCDICDMDLVRAESLGVVGDSSKVKKPLAIPGTAVLFTGPRSMVYLQLAGTENPTYEAREVRLGIRAGDFYTIRSGLKLGDRVVTNGAFRIDSAMQIVAKPSMMSLDSESSDGLNRSKLNLPIDFRYGLKPIFASYLSAQEALALDDLKAFNVAAIDLQNALGFVTEAGLVGELLGEWRRAKLKLKAVVAEDIESGRAQFEGWGEAILEMDQSFGHIGSETWHVMSCPMAFNDRGASWIQRGTDIRNPYFGSSMLACGEVGAALPPIKLENGGGKK